MENLTLEELETLEDWYYWMKCHKSKPSPKDKELYSKIKQAINDKEFEEKKLNF